MASALRYMPEASYELPYEGAKEMLLVEKVDEKEFLHPAVVPCMRNCRPRSRKRKSKRFEFR